MPLPQQVINQLNREPETTPGWSSGVLVFSAALLIVVFAIYFFLIAIYAPHLNTSLAAVQSKIATTDQSVALGDESQLIAFYSQAVNLQSLLANHVIFSQFLNWLGENTEANVFYTQFSFAPGGQVTLTASAKTEADVSQQVAIFESSPEVEKVAVSNISVSTQSGWWSFSTTLIMNPSIFISPTATASATSTP